MFVKSHKNPKKNLEDWGIFRIFVFRKGEEKKPYVTNMFLVLSVRQPK